MAWKSKVEHKLIRMADTIGFDGIRTVKLWSVRVQATATVIQHKQNTD